MAPSGSRTTGLYLQLVLKLIGLDVTLALLLFISAGTARWIAGWWYVAIFASCTLALSLYLLHRDPALARERQTGFAGANRAGWDKAVYGAIRPSFAFWLVSMPVDAVRLGSSIMPVWLQSAGAVILVASFVFHGWVFRSNTFLSPAVRLQMERGHRVVDSGPYAWVRHPLYSATLAYMAGTALMLGSWWGFLTALPLVALIALRAVLEERFLREVMPGYAAYQEKIRYRLVPWVW